MKPENILVELINRRAPTAQALESADTALLVSLAVHEGVESLVAQALSEMASVPGLSERARAHFARALRQSIAREMVFSEERKAVLDAIDSLDAVVLKGAALACLYYPASHLRPMADMDLLIEGRQQADLREALGEIGYRTPPVVGGDLIMNQFMMRKPLGGGLSMDLDIHTRLFNRPALNSLLSHGDILATAVPVSRLGSSARAPSRTHMLAHACLHMLAHHATDRRLVWLYDISLLLDNMENRDASMLLELARESGLSSVLHAVCRDGHRTVSGALQRADGGPGGTGGICCQIDSSRQSGARHTIPPGA